MKALKIVGIIVVILIVAALAIPFFVNADKFRPTVESKLQEELGRQVSIGKLSLSVLTGSVKAENLAIADDPQFSQDPFVRAKSIAIGVELMPLLFHGQANITSLRLDEPQITLLQAPSGVWNFSSLGASKQPQPNVPRKPVPLTIGSLKIKDGRLDIGQAGTGEKPQSYTGVNLEADHVSYTAAFPFTMSATLPGNGKLGIKGTAGPINMNDAAQTPFNAALDVKALDLTQYLGPESGMAGKADYTGKVASNGQSVSSQGSLKAKDLVLAKGGSPAPQAVTFDYATEVSLKSMSGTLRNGALKLGKSAASINGTYDAHGKTPIVNLHFSAPRMPVDDLQALLPALGVTLPRGAALKGGSISTNLAISGPLNALVISGPVQLSDTHLAGFNMGSKMAAVAALAGLNTGSDTHVQHLNTALHFAPDGIHFEDIDGAVEGIGTLAGSGTVSPNKALDFRLTAALAKGNSSAVIPVSSIAANGIPFFVRGTASDPQFVPDTSRMAQSAIQGLLQKNAANGKSNNNLQNLQQGLSKLFGKKKQ